VRTGTCPLLLIIIGIAVSGGFTQSAGQRAISAPVQVSAERSSDPEVVGVVREFLASQEADARASALEWITRDPRAQDDGLIPVIFKALKDPNSGVRNQALANMGWIFERRREDHEGEEALAAIESALKQTSDRPVRLVAVDLIRGSARKTEYDTGGEAKREGSLVANPRIQALVASLLADPEGSLRPELLTVIEASAGLQAIPEIIKAVGEALRDNSLTVRSNAADLLITIFQSQSQARERARPMLMAALEENDPNVQLRVSRALGVPIPPRKTQPPVLSVTGEKVPVADVPFDFNYFTAFIQPLFLQPRGNEACVDCHTPEANASGSFRILSPGPNGRYTPEQSRVNFASVLSVIDRQDPTRSKLLLKPLNPRAPEGGLRGITHDGGVFWDTRYDRDFQVFEDWLKGAKLETPPDKQLDYAYFVQHVEPIFSTPGPDGFACINCHSTHAIFHLESPDTREGKFSVEQLENNYQAAHRVIDELAPGNSFILRKPTSPREGDPGGISHAGGIRWPERKESWQYKTLLTWMATPNLARK